jgi:hypothetical protein
MPRVLCASVERHGLGEVPAVAPRLRQLAAEDRVGRIGRHQGFELAQGGRVAVLETIVRPLEALEEVDHGLGIDAPGSSLHRRRLGAAGRVAEARQASPGLGVRHDRRSRYGAGRDLGQPRREALGRIRRTAIQ